MAMVNKTDNTIGARCHSILERQVLLTILIFAQRGFNNNRKVAKKLAITDCVKQYCIGMGGKF